MLLLAATSGCSPLLSSHVEVFGTAKQPVHVQPIELRPEAVQSGLATSDELTQLLLEKIRDRGIEVTDAGSASTIYCEVPALAYEIKPGYPRHVFYHSTLTCSLMDRDTQTVRWQRQLDQEYDEAVLFNTMTKLPELHDPLMWHEVIVPLWDSMALALRYYLDRPAVAVGTVAPPADVAPPAPAPEYTK